MQPPTEPDRPAPEPDQARAPGPRDSAPAVPAAPAIRASDRERDAAVQQLQVAFAEGRIDDQEFEERMRAALVARTRAELDQVLADLPRAASRAVAPAPTAGGLLLAFKGGVQRRGRWRVPERLNAVAYKGDCQVDLRAAKLSASSTTITAVAYKGRVEIVVPPGVRVQVDGWSYGGHWADEVPDRDLPADAPVVHVRAVAYKGVVDARATPTPAGEITRG
jgi:pyruvate/2-oxoglutarate dehydrogenase complex dihydrolipoamide acyltransferase (E2) component